MKTEIVKPFFSVYGIKKRARKVDRHIKELRSMTLEEFNANKALLLSAFRGHLNTDFRSVGAASLDYWPGYRENGMEILKPFSKVTVESIEAVRK